MLIITIIVILTLTITGVILYVAHRYKQKRAEALGLPPEPEAPEIPETTTAPETEAPVVTEAPAITEAPATTEAPAVTEPAPEKKGCGSSIGFGIVAILSAMAAAVALKKKD